MKNRWLCLLGLTVIVIVGCSNKMPAQFELERAFPNISFESPLDLQNAGDGTNRIFVVERGGRIYVFENSPGTDEKKLFLDISERVTSGGERGLLGLAFHPEYEDNGYFYVNYTRADSSYISRFTVSSNPDEADAESELVLLTQYQPFSNHNGGCVAFGPDGYLYIAFGDGGSGGDPQNNAQNRSTLLGKILRIDVDNGNPYAIPDGNPYKGNSSGFREEIYALGLRNPWRFSFDFETGLLWCADVGQSAWEEINLIEAGGNYGWRCYEGSHPYETGGCADMDEYNNPIWEYGHDDEGGFSVTGGYVYRGPGVPELEGKYVYADYVSRNVWALTYNDSDDVDNELLLRAEGSITSFGVDEQNELYIVSFDNYIYRFKPTATGVGSAEPIPSDYSLEQNYPNPFNPATTVNYSLPADGGVTLTVSDMLGRTVYSSFLPGMPAGTHTFSFDGTALASGIYYLTLSPVNSSPLTIKMTLLK